MKICPVCEKTDQGSVCSECGFEESGYYECYPTLMRIKGVVLSASGRRIQVRRQKQDKGVCPHCGRAIDETAICHICGLPVNPEDIANLCCRIFDRHLKNLDRYIRRKLLPCAENIMRYVEYIDRKRLSEEYVQIFQNLADGNVTDLSSAEQKAFRCMAADLRYLISRPDMILEKDPDYQMQSQVMRQRIDGSQKTKLKSNKFDINRYLRLTNTLLFMTAEEAFVKKDYDKARRLYTCALNQGNIYAATRLGMMYHYGYGCDIDDDEAKEMFHKARSLCPLACVWILEYDWNALPDRPRVDVQPVDSFSGDGSVVDWIFRDSYGTALESRREQIQDTYRMLAGRMEELCDVGDWAALGFWGYNILKGIGVDQDVARGFHMLSVAMDRGDPYAQVLVSECYYWGWGVARNYKKAYTMLKKYAFSRWKKARYLLGCCYYYGSGTEQDLSRAFPHFQVAAKMGHSSAMLLLGDCYRLGHGIPVNEVEARYWYRSAVNRDGNPDAAFNLTIMCYHGIGGDKNYDDAMRYCVYAANKGVAGAQYMLAVCYEGGSFVKQNRQAAQLWMEKAAEQGNPEHQYMMGRFYCDDSEYRNDQLAYQWFLKAANQNSPVAQYYVGMFHQKGTYVEQDYAEANRWYQLALEGGWKKAALELGVHYLNGLGTEPDYSKAVQYLKEAADAGFHIARLELCRQFIRRKEDLEDAYRWLDKELSGSSVEQKIRAEALYLQSVCLQKGYGVSKDKKMAKKLHTMAIQEGYRESEKSKGLRSIFLKESNRKKV